MLYALVRLTFLFLFKFFPALVKIYFMQMNFYNNIYCSRIIKDKSEEQSKVLVRRLYMLCVACIRMRCVALRCVVMSVNTWSKRGGDGEGRRRFTCVVHCSCVSASNIPVRMPTPHRTLVHTLIQFLQKREYVFYTHHKVII